MSLNESIKSLLGYSRQERRSAIILLLIIITVGGIRYVIPEKEVDISELQPELNIMQDAVMVYQDTRKAGTTADKKNIIKSSKPPMDLNSCDSAQLESLPGIGPVLSARIIKYRNLLGGFVSVDQLREVYGLPEETFNLVSSRLYTDTLIIRKIKINHTRYAELVRFPYFSKDEVAAITKYRQLIGPLKGINDLLSNRIIDSVKAGKIKPYLDFSE